MSSNSENMKASTPVIGTVEKEQTDARQFANLAASTAGEILDSAKQKASGAYNAGREAAASAGGAMADAISIVATDASKAFLTNVEDHKNASASALADLARSAQESAENFSDQAPQVAQAIKSVAGRLERVSNDIKDATISDMFDSVTAFAHKQPVAFLGCGIFAGLVLARLLTSPAKA